MAGDTLLPTSIHEHSSTDCVAVDDSAAKRLYGNTIIMRQIIEHFGRAELRKIMLLDKSFLPMVLEVMYKDIRLEKVMKFDRNKPFGDVMCDAVQTTIFDGTLAVPRNLHMDVLNPLDFATIRAIKEKCPNLKRIKSLDNRRFVRPQTHVLSIDKWRLDLAIGDFGGHIDLHERITVESLSDVGALHYASLARPAPSDQFKIKYGINLCFERDIHKEYARTARTTPPPKDPAELQAFLLAQWSYWRELEQEAMNIIAETPGIWALRLPDWTYTLDSGMVIGMMKTRAENGLSFIHTLTGRMAKNAFEPVHLASIARLAPGKLRHIKLDKGCHPTRSFGADQVSAAIKIFDQNQPGLEKFSMSGIAIHNSVSGLAVSARLGVSAFALSHHVRRIVESSDRPIHTLELEYAREPATLTDFATFVPVFMALKQLQTIRVDGISLRKACDGRPMQFIVYFPAESDIVGLEAILEACGQDLRAVCFGHTGPVNIPLKIVWLHLCAPNVNELFIRMNLDVKFPRPRWVAAKPLPTNLRKFTLYLNEFDRIQSFMDYNWVARAIELAALTSNECKIELHMQDTAYETWPDYSSAFDNLVRWIRSLTICTKYNLYDADCFALGILPLHPQMDYNQVQFDDCDKIIAYNRDHLK